MGASLNHYVSWLQRDARTSSVAIESDGLLITIDQEPIRVVVDSTHHRTAIWALVRRLGPGEIANAASAASTFNQDRFDRDGLVMGLHKSQSILILGRSLDGDVLEESVLKDALLELSGSIYDAREIFASASRSDRPAADVPVAHFIRI
jgi:hypothetical protein